MKFWVKEKVTTEMRRLFNRQRVQAGMAKAGEKLIQWLKAYYEQKDWDEPNRLTLERRTHFWHQIGESILPKPKIEQGRIHVIITDPRFPQKVFGGPIVPKRAKALTIPVHPDAYARTAAEVARIVGPLHIIKAGGEAFLVADKSRYTFAPLFVLKRKVNQKPWPGALPKTAKMKGVLSEELKRYFVERLQQTRDYFRPKSL
jgi:hypothetical protein